MQSLGLRVRKAVGPGRVCNEQMHRGTDTVLDRTL